MNPPVLSDSPALWIVIGTSAGAVIPAAFLALRPILTAVAVLLLDRSKCPVMRLRMLQSFTGKAPPGARVDPEARGGKRGVRRQKRKHRRGSGKYGTTRKR